MALIKTQKEIEIVREGGRRLANVLAHVAQRALPGVIAAELNDHAERLIRAGGDTPSFLGYTPRGAKRPFPAVLCVSVNDEVVHGIPNEREKILREGDIVGLDLGLWHEGLAVDMAITVGVGVIDAAAKKLIETTRAALAAGIAAVRPGIRSGDIGHAIEQLVRSVGRGYGIVEDLGGHGVGHAVHEEPHIPNFSARGKGTVLKEGMVLAIEPMLNERSHKVVLDPDGYTFRTKDGKRSAHLEHTIVVTKTASDILTLPKGDSPLFLKKSVL